MLPRFMISSTEIDFNEPITTPAIEPKPSMLIIGSLPYQLANGCSIAARTCGTGRL
jgi:hypothetical protein